MYPLSPLRAESTGLRDPLANGGNSPLDAGIGCVEWHSVQLFAAFARASTFVRWNLWLNFRRVGSTHLPLLLVSVRPKFGCFPTSNAVVTLTEAGTTSGF